MRHGKTRRSLIAALTAIVLTSGSALPAGAADPFRSGNAARSTIGPALQSAFEDFFRNGDYLNAGQKLTKAQQQNPDEPLVYALQAALAYQEGQVDRIVALAQKTRQVAQALEPRDPSRAHLYLGLAQGLEGSSIYLKDGILGLPRVLTYVPGMFAEINQARQLSPDDPEINLFVGYIDVLLTKFDEALAEFRKAAPMYLSFRGQALAHRDRKDYKMALTMVDRAIEAAPRNPDLYYLKGQILALQGNPTAAISLFDQALELGKQLPEGTRRQILSEKQQRLNDIAAAEARGK